MHRFRWVYDLKENASYKIVALFIAVILWSTIEGRRDFVLTKNLEINLQLSPHQILVSQSATEVKVKMSGPRVALQKFVDQGLSQLIHINLSKQKEGSHEVTILPHQIEVPFGVKVISIKPEHFTVSIKGRETP